MVDLDLPLRDRLARRADPHLVAPMSLAHLDDPADPMLSALMTGPRTARGWEGQGDDQGRGAADEKAPDALAASLHPGHLDSFDTGPRSNCDQPYSRPAARSSQTPRCASSSRLAGVRSRDQPDRPAADDRPVGLLPGRVVVGEGLGDLRPTALAVLSVQADQLGARSDREQRFDRLGHVRAHEVVEVALLQLDLL